MHTYACSNNNCGGGGGGGSEVGGGAKLSWGLGILLKSSQDEHSEKYYHRDTQRVLSSQTDFVTMMEQTVTRG